MKSARNISRAIRWLMSIGLMAILLTGVSAAQTRLLAPDAPMADDGVLEYGDEWVNDYPGTSNDLSATDDDARGLGNRLAGCGWTWRFDYGNGDAWEEDWKRSASGGTEAAYVDTVDLAYFSGHGSSTGIYFGVGGNTRDDSQLTYNDCYMSWGDGDAEWVGLSACNVLDDPHLGDWAWCMNKLHLILGFKTTMADTAHGYWLGQYICQGYNMRQAWFMASDRSQPAGKIARVLAEEDAHFYDRYWNHTGGDSWDSDYFWSDHKVGCEPPRQVDIAALDGAMPVFLTPVLSLAQAQNQWGKLGNAFGVSTTPTMKLDAGSMGAWQEGELWGSTDTQLQMDSSNGLYAYTNKTSLWGSPSTAEVAGVTRVQVSPDDARQIADQFLAANGLMPADAHFYEVVADTQSGGALPQPGAAGAANAEQTENVVWQVVYSRVVSAPQVTAAGVQETTFSVVGPGAKLKIYVPTETLVTAAGVQTPQVIGGVGGWRQVGSQATAAAVQTVPILDYEQVLKLFNQLEPTVALGYVAADFVTREVLSHTVGYYEHPMGMGQDQLIPAYVLNVKYNQAGGQTVTSDVYMPANPQFSAPLAKITPTSQVPEVVRVGQTLSFQATDASKKLSELGYDASLNFALGTGDPDSYLYSWYRDAVAPENKIGAGRTLNYKVALSDDHGGEGTVPQAIILEVKDTASQRPPSIMTTAYSINVARAKFLPVLLR